MDVHWDGNFAGDFNALQMFYFFSHVVTRFFEFFRIVFILCNFFLHFGSLRVLWRWFLYNFHLHYVSGAVYVLLHCVSAQFNVSFSTSAEFRGSNDGGNARTLPSQQRSAETLACRSSAPKKSTENMLVKYNRMCFMPITSSYCRSVLFERTTLVHTFLIVSFWSLFITILFFFHW